MSATLTPATLAEVQQVVLLPPRGAVVSHVVVHFPCGQAGRGFLNLLTPCLSFGTEPVVGVERSLGLTFEGLRVLCVPTGYLAVVRGVSRAFAQGAAARAAEYLGDTGESAFTHWRKDFQPDVAHAVVSLHAPDEAQLDTAQRELFTLADKAGVTLRRPHRGQRLDAPAGLTVPRGDTRQAHYVHFGYRDGLSTVAVNGFPGTDGQTPDAHAMGEFLLSHANDHGSNPWGLAGRHERLRAFFRNASFGVLRVIEQDVEGFEKAVDGWAEQVARDRHEHARAPAWRDYVKAKLCGRWPSGHVFDPKNGDLPLDKDQAPCDTHSHQGDDKGHCCPFGAHTRRLNPRSGIHARSRTVIRRSTPYGDWKDKERGLLGWFFCADIEGQFEHLLGQWVDRSPLGAAAPTHNKDPLVGQHENAQAVFVIPRAGGEQAHRLAGFAPFCTTRGTLYALYPTHSALERMASWDYEHDRDPEDWP